MPHADSSYFAAGSSKDQVYEQVFEQAQGLLTGQRNWVSNLANVASLLWHGYAALPEPLSSVNWAGFYIRNDLFPRASYSDTDRKLLLGPFQGKPACQEIKFGRGVCGTAALKRETVLVADVLEFPGHIACDADSRSEIVVPILFEGETVAIIDIDCAQPAGFDEVDRKHLERLAALLAGSCDWTPESCRPSPQRQFQATNTIQSTWSAVPPESPVPPWISSSATRSSWKGSLRNCSDTRSNTNPSFIDICFEQQPTTTTTSPNTNAAAAATSPAAAASSHIPHSVTSWTDPCQAVSTVASLDQLPVTFDFDFLFAATSSTSPHTASATSPGQTDLPLDFSSHDFDTSFDLASQHWLPEQIDLSTVAAVGEHPETILPHSSTAALLGSHSAPLDMVSLEMDRFASTATHASSSTTTMFDMHNHNNNTTSPDSITSLSYSRDHRPLLAPKQTTTPPSSLSASPPVSLIDTATTTKRATGTKRARAGSAAAVDSSNNSAQDSEDERIVEKRRRNTMAARRFRKRKLDHVSDLESRLAKMTEERDELRLQIAKWEGEVMALRKLMDRKET